jgi:hypothetical protein
VQFRTLGILLKAVTGGTVEFNRYINWHICTLYIDNFGKTVCKTRKPAYFCAPFNRETMAVTRLKRKNRKDKAKAAVRRQTLKLQNFKPVQKNVDIEKIKEEFKTKTKAEKKA